MERLGLRTAIWWSALSLDPHPRCSYRKMSTHLSPESGRFAGVCLGFHRSYIIPWITQATSPFSVQYRCYLLFLHSCQAGWLSVNQQEPPRGTQPCSQTWLTFEGRFLECSTQGSGTVLLGVTMRAPETAMQELACPSGIEMGVLGLLSVVEAWFVNFPKATCMRAG